jgi:inhibitor of KinA
MALRIEPMGDQAVLAHCQDERTALALAAQVRAREFPWMVDIVQAYQSVAFFVDLERIDFPKAAAVLAEIDQTRPATLDVPGALHVIPCCYELGLDLERVAQAAGLGVQEVIALHAREIYTVYAIGFCPGFPYLGYLPESLRGIPRLPSPRLRVEAGSVGLTGKQTGIYTMDRPGGWNIVGRTPLQLVDVAAGYFPLRTGDRVQFRSIDLPEFEALRGKRIL